MSDSQNVASIQHPDFFRTLDLFALKPRKEGLEFLDLLKPLILARPGFPTHADIMTDGRDYPWIIHVQDIEIRRELATTFHMGPTMENEEMFLKTMFFPGKNAGFEKLIGLLAPRLRDPDSGAVTRDYDAVAPLVDKYVTLIEQQFKQGSTFLFLFKHHLYQPRVSLLSGLLDFSWMADAQPRDMSFISCLKERRMRLSYYDAFLFALKHLSQYITGAHLVQAIEIVAGELSDKRPAAKMRALVRCLLWYGCSPSDFAVKQKVLSSGYRGFAEDIYEVKCWKRWAELQALGNLPAEILEMVMFCKWDEFC